MPSISVLDATGAPVTVQTLPAVGSAAATASLPVVIAADQALWPATQTISGAVTVSNTVLVSGAFYPTTQPISGSVVVTGSVAVTGAFQATQPISVATLPLPTGASTEATLAALNTKTPAVGLTVESGASPITPASDSYQLRSATTCSRLILSAATTNSTNVKSATGGLKAIQGYNAKAAPVFLKLYDKATSPTVGTDIPVKTIYLPATGAFALDFAFKFVNGIGYALTLGAADTDTTALVAGDILCLNIDYI